MTGTPRDLRAAGMSTEAAHFAIASANEGEIGAARPDAEDTNHGWEDSHVHRRCGLRGRLILAVRQHLCPVPVRRWESTLPCHRQARFQVVCFGSLHGVTYTHVKTDRNDDHHTNRNLLLGTAGADDIS